MGLTSSPAFSTPLIVKASYFIFHLPTIKNISLSILKGNFYKKEYSNRMEIGDGLRMYVRQQGPDCVVFRDGKRYVVKDCKAAKLKNTLFDKLGPKYTNREMYKFGFIPEM